MAENCKPCPAPDPKTPFTGVKIGESGSGVGECPPTIPCPPTPPLSNLTEAPPETTWGGNDGQGGTGIPPTVPPTPPTPSVTPQLPSPVVFPSLLKGINPDGTLQWYTDTLGFSVLLSGHASNADFSWEQMPTWFLDAFGIVNPAPPNDPPSVPINSVLLRPNVGNAFWADLAALISGGPYDPLKAYALGFDVGTSQISFFPTSGGGGVVPGWVTPPVPTWSVPLSDGAGAVGWFSPFGGGVPAFLTWDSVGVQFLWDTIPTFLVDVLNSVANPFSFLTTDGAGVPLWDQVTLSTTGLPGFPAVNDAFLVIESGALVWEQVTWANSSFLTTDVAGNLIWDGIPSFLLDSLNAAVPANSVLFSLAANSETWLNWPNAGSNASTIPATLDYLGNNGGTIQWKSFPSWFTSSLNYLSNVAGTPTWASFGPWFAKLNAPTANAIFWYDGANFQWTQPSPSGPNFVVVDKVTGLSYVTPASLPYKRVVQINLGEVLATTDGITTYSFASSFVPTNNTGGSSTWKVIAAYCWRLGSAANPNPPHAIMTFDVRVGASSWITAGTQIASGSLAEGHDNTSTLSINNVTFTTGNRIGFSYSMPVINPPQDDWASVTLTLQEQ